MAPLFVLPRRWRVGDLRVGLTVLAAVRLLATGFQLFLRTNIVVRALALIGVNLLVGCNG